MVTLAAKMGKISKNNAKLYQKTLKNSLTRILGGKRPPVKKISAVFIDYFGPKNSVFLGYFKHYCISV